MRRLSSKKILMLRVLSRPWAAAASAKRRRSARREEGARGHHHAVEAHPQLSNRIRQAPRRTPGVVLKATKQRLGVLLAGLLRIARREKRHQGGDHP